MFVPVTVVVILIFTAMGSVVSDTYKKGGVAVLSPGSVSGPITSVTWKHGPDIAVERYGEETIEYRDFKGRCEVDTNTGALRILNLSVNDSGIYTAEINSRIMNTAEITVITAVPKPTISTQCNPEKTQCTLTCEASITTDTGPVIYSWETGDRQRPSSSKQLVIAKDDPKMIGQPISCQLENPVSRERSDVIMSPFMTKSSGGVNPAAAIVWIVLAVPIVLAVLIVAVRVGLVLWHKRRPENAEKNTYKKGGVAVLSPGSVSGPITNIVWKHGPHMAVDWYGEETMEYRDFKETSAVASKTEETLKHHPLQED